MLLIGSISTPVTNETQRTNLAITITPDGDGNAQISYGRPGMTVNPPVPDPVTGVYGEYEPEISPIYDARFNQYDEQEALPPEYHIDDSKDGQFDLESYARDLRVVNPTFDTALEWAAAGEAVGIDINQFNADIDEACDSGNLEKLNELVERLCHQYEEAGQIVETSDSEETQSPVDELFNELSEEVQEQLNESPEDKQALADVGNWLIGQQPSQETADEASAYADELHQNADHEGALLFALSAQFHSGGMSAQECISTAVQKLGLTRSYNALQRLVLQENSGMQYGYTETSDTAY